MLNPILVDWQSVTACPSWIHGYLILVRRFSRTKASSPAQVAAIKVFSSTVACAVASIHAWKTQSLTCLLRRIYLRLQRDGTLINSLQLTEMRIEDADDLRDLDIKHQ